MAGVMSSSKIIVTGSNGQLGGEIKDLSTHFPQYDFIFLSREDVSITDIVSLKNVFDQHHPEWVVNCAAYTAVDKAETEKDMAFEINGTAVGHLAELCREHNANFIHISTDYVFNGSGNKPWKETDVADPLSVYGASKLQGELQALKNNPQSIIIRTSWVYSSYGKNFLKTMIRLMKEKDSINVVNDQYGSPTYAADLASAIMQIIVAGKIIPGVFHFSNTGGITWFEFAEEIRRIIQFDCEVKPISTEQYPTPATRPHYSVLDTTKIQQEYGIILKNWKDSLLKCIQKLTAIS